MSASAGQENRAGTITLAHEDAVKQVLTESILGLWDVVNSLRAAMLSTEPPASLEDMGIPRCVSSADEAIAVLREHHDRWRRAQAD